MTFRSQANTLTTEPPSHPWCACCNTTLDCWNCDAATFVIECYFSVPVCCNYIAIKCRNSGVYQYAVSFCPEVDSLRMRYKMLEEQKTRDIIGEVKAFDGRILFLPVQLKNLVFLFIQFINAVKYCQGRFVAIWSSCAVLQVFTLCWSI